MQNVLPTFQRAAETDKQTDRQIINLIRCDYTLILYVVGALIHLLPLPSPPHCLFPLFACHTSTFTCSKLQQKQLLLVLLLLLWLLLLLVATSNCSQVAAVRRTRCGTSNATSRCRNVRNDVAAAARITMPASKSQCCCLAPTLPANSWQGTNTHTYTHTRSTRQVTTSCAAAVAAHATPINKCKGKNKVKAESRRAGRRSF